MADDIPEADEAWFKAAKLRLPRDPGPSWITIYGCFIFTVGIALVGWAVLLYVTRPA